MMRILVTGGAGFIGSNFIFYVLDKYASSEVVCLDCLTYAGNLHTLAAVAKNPRFTFAKVSITDKEAVERVFEAAVPDVVVNFAAESHVDRAIKSPQIFLDTNIRGTAILMDACIRYGVKRFHQVSTDEVYGELPLAGDAPAFTEETTLCPGNPYSASKASADLLALSYYKTYGLPVTISRCSNNYGPYQDTEKLIPLMVSRALCGCPLPVYGTGENIRDWIYVEDHCDAIDSILRGGCVGQVYNVGSRSERRNLDIVKYICAELGKPESLIQFVEDRKGHDKRYAVNPEKIMRELNWKPRMEFEVGLKRTIQWYQENRKWWETR